MASSARKLREWTAARREMGAGGGGKGATPSSPTEAPNTLQSRQMARLIDLLAGGKIRGPAIGVDWYKSTFMDKTPVVGADGTVNLPGVVLEARLGDPDQAYLAGFPSVETIRPVGVTVDFATPVVRPITNANTDAVRVGLGLGALVKQGDDGGLKGHTVSIKIEVKSSADQPESEYVTRVEDTISGKCTSPYTRGYRIELPGEAPWDIRMSRVSPDDTETSTQSTISFSYYTELVDRKMIYPSNAIVGITANAELFGSRVPERGYEIFGLELQIPENYTAFDTGGGHCDGEWDGNFVSGWCSNPMWVLNDLVVNGRYGLGDLFTQLDVDKYTLYQIAQYCDGASTRAATFTGTFTKTSEVALAAGVYSAGDITPNSQQVYSNQGGVGRACAFAQSGATDSVAFGLNAATTGTSAASIDFAIELQSDGTYRALASGASIWDTNDTYVANDEFRVFYEATAVRFYKNGVLKHTATTTADQTLYFDSSFGAFSELRNIAFDDGGWTNDYEITGIHGVPDGFGGFEPRFAFNGVINTREQAVKVLEAVAGMMRVAVLWHGGVLSAVQDAPTAPSKPFAAANVKEGMFNYAGTSFTARHTICHVNWVDPSRGYEGDTAVIEDRESIQRYGYNLLEITAYGCTSYGQAYRTGLAALLTERLETDTVTFEVGLQDGDVRPGDIIEVMDPLFQGAEYGGRIMTCSETVVVLDRAFPFDSARTYTITMMDSHGRMFTREIDNPGTTTATLTLLDAIEDSILPLPGSMFIIEDDVVEARTFRVMQVAEQNEVELKVFAIEYNASKFALIDSGVLDTSVTSDFDPLETPWEIAAPANLRAHFTMRTVGSKVVGVLAFEWDPVVNPYFDHYDAAVQQGDDSWYQVRNLLEPRLEILEPHPEVVKVLVRAANMSLRNSPVAVYSIDLRSGTYLGKPCIDYPEIEGGGYIWGGPDATLTWVFRSPYMLAAPESDVVTPDPFFSRFEIDICVWPTTTVIETFESLLPRFTLTRDLMTTISGGQAMRRYSARIYAVDTGGNRSNAAIVNMQNPAPALPTHTKTVVASGVSISFSPTLDADFVGVKVWMSETSGFTPNDATNLVYNGAGDAFIPLVPANPTKYYKFAAYDAFSDDITELNISTQQSLVPSEVLQYVNDDGTVTDGGFFPPGVMGGTGLVRSDFPFSGVTDTTISIQSHTVRKGNISLGTFPPGTLTSLSASTLYYVFRDMVGSSYVYTSSYATAEAYYADLTGQYVPLGAISTTASGCLLYTSPSPRD